eukprot:TRINITY_DN919_c1_g1_i1.p1 TRINITY_DN919_c1_g1~~TRINITY_DN919_c1_g1_i1.p1  ORF type:complete len:571 (+),score=131.97 TRINITY_DN919_c1_g1_i1:42-1754(+)
MIRGLSRRLLCVPSFKVIDGHQVQVVPNRLSIAVENCEVRGVGGEALPFWRLETKGLESGEEVVMVKGRDIMRPRDQTMLLGLFESIHEMVQDGAVLDESAEVPMETGRATRKQNLMKDVGPEGFDHLHTNELLPEATESEISLWLTFYAHPSLPATRFLLLVSPNLRSLSTTFKTPLRLTNLMFKHNSWNFLPPAAYRETPVPSEADVSESVLKHESVVAIPGLSVTMVSGVCEVIIPDNANTTLILKEVEASSGEVVLVASRHEQGVDGFCCWDPANKMDSLVISTRGDTVNWNDTSTDTSACRIGGTFVKLTSKQGADQTTLEDGYCIPVATDTISSVLSGNSVETPNLKVRFVKGLIVSTPALPGVEVSDEDANLPLDDWLSYIKNAVGSKQREKEVQQTARQDTRRQNLSREPPEMKHFKTEVKPIIEEKKEEVEENKPQESPAEERTTVEPRMVKADFGEYSTDERAQTEEWEKYVIRVATVLSAVFSHCGRRSRPTKGKDEPGSVLVELRVADDGSMAIHAEVDTLVCSMELIPEGIEILTKRLNKHCGQPPHNLPLKIWFSL